MNPNPTILIVEDEPLIRLALVDMFEDAGFAVLEAGDAAEAITLLDTHAENIGILLTDTGWEMGPTAGMLPAMPDPSWKTSRSSLFQEIALAIGVKLESIEA